MALSYGEIQTQRLCLTPWLANEASSAARLTSAGVSGPPNAFLLRTYFHMNSPIMAAAIASTTLVCDTALLVNPLADPLAVKPVAAVAVDSWCRWRKPLALTMSLGSGGIESVSALLGVAGIVGDLLRERAPFATGAADRTLRRLSFR